MSIHMLEYEYMVKEAKREGKNPDDIPTPMDILRQEYEGNMDRIMQDLKDPYPKIKIKGTPE